MAIVNPTTGKTNEEVLAESTRVAQEAAKMIGGTFEQGRLSPTGEVLGGFTPVTTDSFTTFPTNVVTPEAPPAPAMPEIDLSPAEQDVQKQIEELQGLVTDASGKEAFQVKAEESVGLPGLEATQRDLQAQLKQLAADSLAGTEAIRHTPKSLVAIQRETERFNREIAVKSLGLNALLEASRGNIATARDAVDRAVKAKYAPIEAEIAAKQANLDLLLKSPKITAAERRRAEAQKARQTEEAQRLEEQATTQKRIWDVSVDASVAGAPSEILRRIQNATTEQEALQLAAPYLQRAVGGVGGASAIGISPVTNKPFTESQSKAGTFATRMEQAESLLEDGKLFRNIALFGIQALKSNERRQFEQAENNFITALLRRESGAAIAEDEYDYARRVYIPQFGDDETTLEQKAEARRIALQGMINESVGAYDQLKGTLPTSGTTSGVTQSGIKYTIIEQ